MTGIINPLGFLKGLQRFLFQFTGGQASGLNATPVILFNADGNPSSIEVITGPVAGADAAGTAAAHNPVLVAGEDAGGIVRTVLTDNAGKVQINGTVTASLPTSSTASGPASVSASVTPVTLLAANTARKGCTITNNSTSALYVSLGSTVSSTDYGFVLYQNDYYEDAFNYTGLITGVWAVATGNAFIQELT